MAQLASSWPGVAHRISAVLTQTSQGTVKAGPAVTFGTKESL
ncbi:hypothetical protein ACH4UM_21295 [Streptomyces sp. NPDC020801]